MAREMAHAVDPRPRLSEPPPHYVRPERVSPLVGSGQTESLVAHPRTVDECRDVLDYCQGKLARFKQPRGVAFIDELPRNPSGKVLKRELRELFPGPAPE